MERPPLRSGRFTPPVYKLNYHPPGTAPATLVSHSTSTNPVRITLIEYTDATFEEKVVTDIEEVFSARDNDRISWINIDGTNDPVLLQRMGKYFGLHPLALEDVLNTSQRPKLEEFENHFFIVARMLYLEEDAGCLTSEQVSIFLGKGFVITVQEEAGRDVFEPVRNRLRQGRGFARSSGADYLVYALLDAITDHFFPILETAGESIEELEDVMLEHPEPESLHELHSHKRMLLQMRRAAWPLRELLNQLHRDESGMVAHSTKIFLRDCYDHAIQIIEIIESYRDLVAGMTELYLSSVSLKTNDIMRVLTVISAVFIPLTFLAGVYGMNFNPEAGPWSMPELNHPFGYPAILGVMLFLAGGMLLFFRRKRWI